MADDSNEAQPEAALAAAGGKWRRRFRRMTPIIGIAILCAALWIIFRELSANDPAEIWASFMRMKPGSITLTLFLCLTSFAMLALIERSVLQMLHCEQRFLSVFRSAFVTYGLSNAIGFSYASAPATRARIYRDRLRAREIGALSAITAASVALGALTAAGVSLSLGPPHLPKASFLTGNVSQVLAFVLIAPAALWIAVSGTRGQVSFWGLRFRALGFRRAILQVVFTTIDWLSTAGILFCFLPADLGWSYASFVSVFVAAGLIGAVSGTPGGLGPFEAAILSLAPPQASTPALVAALVAYRMVFTVAPLCIASLILAGDFMRKSKRKK